MKRSGTVHIAHSGVGTPTQQQFHACSDAATSCIVQWSTCFRIITWTLDWPRTCLQQQPCHSVSDIPGGKATLERVVQRPATITLFVKVLGAIPQ
jgi:hypothetical protein